MLCAIDGFQSDCTTGNEQDIAFRLAQRMCRLVPLFDAALVTRLNNDSPHF
jgi:hypothetical protein